MHLAGHDSETGPTVYLSTEPVSRRLALTLALWTLLRCIAFALYTYKGRHSRTVELHCGHTFVRLLSIGKIVRSNSNCQRSTLKRRTTPGQIDRRNGASRGYAHALAAHACAIDCTLTKVGFLACFQENVNQRSRNAEAVRGGHSPPRSLCCQISG